MKGSSYIFFIHSSRESPQLFLSHSQPPNVMESKEWKIKKLSHSHLILNGTYCLTENIIYFRIHPSTWKSSSSLPSSFLSLSLIFFLSSKKMKASSIFHVHTCEYPLRKQIIIIIRRELEDKLMREQRERREEQKSVRLTVWEDKTKEVIF